MKMNHVHVWCSRTDIKKSWQLVSPDMAANSRSPKKNGSASPIVVAATFKILVLGNSDVGKSSLIQKYTTGRVTKSLLPTVGEWLLWVSGCHG